MPERALPSLMLLVNRLLMRTPTIRLGRRLLVPTARLHQLLGITSTDDLEPDAPANDPTVAGRRP